MDRILKLLQFLGRPILYGLLYSLLYLTYLIFTLASLAKSLRRTSPTPLKTRLIIIFSFLFLYYVLNTTYYILNTLPSPHLLSTNPPHLTTIIFDRYEQPLYKIYRDENRSLVKLADLPQYISLAHIAIEDQNFYRHHGFDLRGIFRAILTNTYNPSTNRTSLQGGSTITQQLIKNALLTPEKTLSRKLRELILAIWTEQIYSKDEILEMYLNQVAYGGTAYGIQAASEQYFDKPATQLTLAEATFLAGLPAAPTTYSPFGSQPEKAHTRHLQVLNQMEKQGYLTPEQVTELAETKLKFTTTKESIQAPHFVMYTRNLLAQELSDDLVHHGGLKVTTTLDLQFHQAAQQIVTREVQSLYNLNVTNGAVLVTDPGTGEILVMVGSQNYFDTEHDGQVNLTQRLRQPGSSIKPVLYSTALQNGFTPASVIQDTPITFQSPGSPPYSPKNYDNKFHGPVTLRQALASSYNVPAVKVLATLGLPKMLTQAKNLGINSWDHNSSRFGLSLTLGGGEVTMLEMATVYGTLANYGARLNLNPIVEIKNQQNQVLYQNPCLFDNPQFENDHQFQFLPTQCFKSLPLSAAIAYQITDILKDNSARAPAFGTHSVLHFPQQEVAVKTGTSDDLKDNWTIGYTTDHLVVAWVGNNDSTPMNRIASGITGASPIWNHTISLTLDPENPHQFPKPTDLIKVKICTLTGQKTCSGCPSRDEYFVPGTEPQTACSPEHIQNLLQQQDKPKTDRDQILTGTFTQQIE